MTNIEQEFLDSFLGGNVDDRYIDIEDATRILTDYTLGIIDDQAHSNVETDSAPTLFADTLPAAQSTALGGLEPIHQATILDTILEESEETPENNQV